MSEKDWCPNCNEPRGNCACMRNICIKCGKPVGNITFTVCDDCWDKEHPAPKVRTKLKMSEKDLELEKKYRANFLWGKEDDLSVLLYEFANGTTEEYIEQVYKSILTFHKSEEVKLLEVLKQCELLASQAIERTPTGNLRDKLTEINLLRLQAISRIEKGVRGSDK